MDDLLDNPVWNAMISGNRSLSSGNDHAKYFDKEVSPFVALSENAPENFRTLFELLPRNGPALFFSPVEMELGPDWQVKRLIRGVQMVCTNPPAATNPPDATTPSGARILPLTKEHISQIIALNRLTDPGPFDTRTIEFGHYFGIFQDGRLISMAGQRLHVFDYAEISAVCTHPDHTGKGYARQLLLQQIHRIRSASCIPFLHVREDNERAIKVYENVGFSIRRRVCFYIMQKAGRPTQAHT
jgi:ribosomal protein S18 acetylase RimI-like enzyme